MERNDDPLCNPKPKPGGVAATLGDGGSSAVSSSTRTKSLGSSILLALSKT